MKVIKNINNNVSLCIDSKGREVVAFGKGIGFIRPPYEIPLEKIDRTFYSHNISDYSVLEEIPVNVIEVSIKIVEELEKSLNVTMLSSAALSIADHINFAIKRNVENVKMEMPIQEDLKLLYPKEILYAEKALKTIKEYTRKIAEEMHVRGLMNMQYAIENGKVYVLEANPRASRTVPLVSKVCNVRMVPLAIDIVTSELTGRKSPVPELKEQDIPYYGVKEAVFPFNMFQEVDPVLGPEMRSTGEVLGLSRFYGEAYYKAQEATQLKIPMEGTVLITVNDRDKAEVADVARQFAETGFKILASKNTYKLLQQEGIEAELVNKMQEGRPNILDLIMNGKIDLIVNTPIGKSENVDDSYLRKAAIKKKVPYITTMAAAKATVSGIQSMKKPGCGEVKSIQELHSEITDKM